jgi:hypothetical protein
MLEFNTQSVDTVMFNLMFNLLPRQKHLMFPAHATRTRQQPSTPARRGEHAARQLGEIGVPSGWLGLLRV